MLPKTLRFHLFEILSLKTMRYVHAIPRRKATELVAQVYDIIEEPFHQWLPHQSLESARTDGRHMDRRT
jgi:hypothetical protein